MKRNRYGGSHAQAPQPTRITAIFIISFFIAAMLIGLLLLICATHKLAGSESSYSGQQRLRLGTTSKGQSAVMPFDAETVVSSSLTCPTHILVDEPLEGGGGLRKTESSKLKLLQDTAVTAPQQRDRPAIEIMQSEVVEAQKARVRADLVARINAFLANSPLAGLGECMMQNAERTGVWVMLAPAQAYAESSLGAVCCYPF